MSDLSSLAYHAIDNVIMITSMHTKHTFIFIVNVGKSLNFGEIFFSYHKRIRSKGF